VKNSFVYLLIFLVSTALFSCRSSQELIYMNNASQKELLANLPDSVTEYIIKPGDILYVSIKSLNAEVNALFNPETNMETSNYNSFQKYTTPQGAYLYGFEVDEAGNLNLPILGSIQVAGYLQSDIEKIVQAKADQYLKEAIVKVKLLNYKVTVLGEVKSPGYTTTTTTVLPYLKPLPWQTETPTMPVLKKSWFYVRSKGQTGLYARLVDQRGFPFRSILFAPQRLCVC
jgi:hypothetical protein